MTVTTADDLKRDLSKLSIEIGDFATETGKLIGGLGARMDEVEQRMVRRGPGGAEPVFGSGGDGLGYGGHGIGAAVVASPEFQEWKKQAVGRVKISIPGGMGQEFAAITSGGGASISPTSLVAPDYRPQIVGAPERRLTIRDLLPTLPTASNMIAFLRETGFSNSAAVVSEGAVKPESDIDYQVKSAPVVTIAHFLTASNQVLSDVASLASTISGKLTYGLKIIEETALLFGDGSEGQIHGLCPQAAAFDPSFDTSFPNDLDVIAEAILQSELALLPATGVILNPINYRKMLTLKSQVGEYLSNGPWSSAPPSLWDTPIVSTPAMPVNSFLVGAFQLGAALYDREEVNVLLSTEDSDNFRKNLTTLRCEERVAMACTRPEAFVFGSFPATT